MSVVGSGIMELYVHKMHVVYTYSSVYDQYSIVQGSAGHYGSRQCDLPMVTLDLLLDTLRDLDPQPDFYIYTGTYVPAL